MRYKLKLLVLTAIIIFLFCSNMNSFASVVLINGDINSLGIIVYTKYLDKKPVLLFTTQERNLNVKDLIQVNNFVFKDSGWKDLAVELSFQSQGHKATGPEVVKSNVTELQVKIKKAGVYEIWIENRNHQLITNQYEYTNKEEWNIEADGKEILQAAGYKLQAAGRKYVKVGEMRLGEGEHRIQVARLRSHQAASQKNRKLKIVLVDKEEREKVEREIWQRINRPKAELCYIFEKKTGEFWVPE